MSTASQSRERGDVVGRLADLAVGRSADLWPLADQPTG
jgi:hypothetical protein